MDDNLHARISRSVVGIRVARDIHTNGVVIVANSDFAYILAHTSLFDKYKGNKHVVELPNKKEIVIPADWLDNNDDSLVAIRCYNSTKGQPCGLEDLVGINLCEHIEENEKVHTYCSRGNNNMLIPGTILLVEAETFDHDCAIDLYTECGSPVVNEAGDLVGMCTSSSNGYLTALNVISIAKKMEALAKRDYKSVEAAVQHVRDVTAVAQNVDN